MNIGFDRKCEFYSLDDILFEYSCLSINRIVINPSNVNPHDILIFILHY